MNFVEWNEKNSFDLFSKIAEINPTGVIATVGVDTIRLNYLITFGQRKVPDSLAGLSLEQIASFIDNMYDSKWENLYISILDSLPSGFDSETVIEENYTDSNIRENENSNVNSVSAFNDDDFSNETKADTNTNTSDVRDKNRILTERKRSLYSVDKRRKMMENENIRNIICEDISKVLGLAIY